MADNEKAIDPRDFGRLEAEVAQLQDLVVQHRNEHKASFEAMQAKLDSIASTLSEARGGWRTLMWAGGAAASAGALLGWAAQHLSFK